MKGKRVHLKCSSHQRTCTFSREFKRKETRKILELFVILSRPEFFFNMHLKDLLSLEKLSFPLLPYTQFLAKNTGGTVMRRQLGFRQQQRAGRGSVPREADLARTLEEVPGSNCFHLLLHYSPAGGSSQHNMTAAALPPPPACCRKSPESPSV